MECSRYEILEEHNDWNDEERSETSFVYVKWMDECFVSLTFNCSTLNCDL